MSRPANIRPGIEGLFDTLHGMYGARFADAWRGTDPAVMREVWKAQLRGYTGLEIGRGLEACKNLKWPPTLPEFLMLCRPPVDYEDAYHECLEQMRLRDSGNDYWPRPALFWAAQVVGGDLMARPYPQVAARWKRAVDACQRDMDAGTLGAVPPRPLALPPAPPAPIPPAIKERIDSILKGHRNAA